MRFDKTESQIGHPSGYDAAVRHLLIRTIMQIQPCWPGFGVERAAKSKHNLNEGERCYERRKVG